jgi:hypothetical protein
MSRLARVQLQTDRLSLITTDMTLGIDGLEWLQDLLE